MPESGLVGGRFREIRQIISDGPRSLIECIDKLDVNNRRVLISRFNDVNYKHQKEIVSEGNRIYKTLRSSHLLELNESFDNDVEIFQIFTFPEGIKSLDTALVKTPYLFILRIIKDLCLFVDEAHAAGFFISFLNPRHLFIAKSGDLKILDTSYFIKNPKSSISLPLPDTIFIAP